MLLKREEQAILSLRELYASRGYRPYKMNQFEEYDLYIRNKEFLVSDQVITFAGRDGRLMALKPDVTLSIVKNAPEEPGVVEKLYYNESVYRADKDTHDFRELTQAGLECVGDLSPYDISEVVLLALKSIAQLGSRYILDISHMGLLEAVLADIPASDRSVFADLLQQKNQHDLTRLCTELGCEDKTLQKLSCLIQHAGRAEAVLPAIEAVMDKAAELSAIADLKAILSIAEAQGFGDAIRVDFSVANGMAYYNGLVFKGYLEGVPDAVLSGGQYDRLPSRMGRKSRAIGFAIYLDLLERLESPKTAYDVDIVLLHNDNADVLGLNRAVSQLSKEGSVLVSSRKPEGYRWEKLYEFVDGEVRILEADD